MKKNDAIRFILLRSLGNFLVLFSIYGVIATFGPAISYELQYRIIQLRGVEFTIGQTVNAQNSINQKHNYPKDSAIATANKTIPNLADIVTGDTKKVLIPLDPLFSIVIPKIGASARIFPNINAEDPNEFLPILQQGVAHAKGSVFPGQPGSTYLFAHSADNWWDVGRYNAIFYTLNNLSEGDEVDVFFENVRYIYVVQRKLISDPQDITLITSLHEGPNQLVLQTCWPPGTTWKRLYVIAQKKKV